MLKPTALFLALVFSGAVLAAEAPVEANPAAAKKAPRDERHCLKETGSRLKRPKDECVPAPGQVITREEIEQSGATDAGEAVRRWVPAAR